MNPENRRIRMADMIPRDAFEKKTRLGMLQSLCAWCTDNTDQIQVFRQRTCGVDNSKSVFVAKIERMQ